jgi:hypothetical protein
MEAGDRDAALERLEAFVGRWSMTAQPPGGPPWPGEASVSFEWLEGRRFLIERWTIEMPEAPDGIAIIGAGDGPDAFRQHYFDSRGIHRVYEMTLEDATWRLWRDATDPFPQRFTGTFSDDGNLITGRWDKAEDGSTWKTDFDLTYRHIG